MSSVKNRKIFLIVAGIIALTLLFIGEATIFWQWGWLFWIVMFLIWGSIGLAFLYLFWRFVWKKSNKLVKGLIIGTVAAIVLTGGGWFAYQQLRGREQLVLTYSEDPPAQRLQWGEYTYTEYGRIPGTERMGKPFGRAGKDFRVYTVEGYPPEEWLILSDLREMMPGPYLFKEDSVADIPEGFNENSVDP